MRTRIPNPATHNPDPAYLRELLDDSGLKQCEAAALLNITPRMMRYYLAETGSPKHLNAPYLVQFALECLAEPRGD